MRAYDRVSSTWPWIEGSSEKLQKGAPMDGFHFDSVARSLTSTSRRNVLLGLLGGSLSLLGVAEASATKKKGGKGKKGKGKTAASTNTVSPSTPSPSCPEGQRPCQGRCIPSNQCCADGDCAANAPRCCQGACIRANECCANNDCGSGTICQSGSCVCPAGTPPCGDRCCAAPAGYPATSVTCLFAGGGAAACSCTHRAADVCAPGCRAQYSITTDCTGQSAAKISEFCRGLGCDAP